MTTDPLDDLRDQVRQAHEILAQDYASRRNLDADFDADGHFFDLRRAIEGRALTLDLVRQGGSMGGGGKDEA